MVWFRSLRVAAGSSARGEAVDDAGAVGVRLEAADAPEAGVRERAVVEVHRVLGGCDDADAEGARLLHQRDDGPLGGRIRWVGKRMRRDGKQLAGSGCGERVLGSSWLLQNAEGARSGAAGWLEERSIEFLKAAGWLTIRALGFSKTAGWVGDALASHFEPASWLRMRVIEFLKAAGWVGDALASHFEAASWLWTRVIEFLKAAGWVGNRGGGDFENGELGGDRRSVAEVPELRRQGATSDDSALVNGKTALGVR
jgi:hypothetical protein